MNYVIVVGGVAVPKNPLMLLVFFVGQFCVIHFKKGEDFPKKQKN
jgi:hypothetical protein